MFGLMKDCTKQLTDYFQRQDGIVTVEMKDTFSRFANDLIATTAFGITCDSLENPENEFFMMGKDVTDFTGFRSLIFFMNGFSSIFMKVTSFVTHNFLKWTVSYLLILAIQCKNYSRQSKRILQ